ncbi:hypothetical protein PQH03_06985 [Ralstonia insidiosa]|uniref:hypothetical protein n=1 Tax=Ralstonia insidiosa TaxID=190721 RepID=UPI00204F0492|nr:hypothetical protein [Ralstonia insidiosa]MDE4924370.1 hypothetical protein [Ralstonia insidiosa]UNJ99913.1 hypothetical protein MMB19_14425 [Ralstonia insidiosa]
MYATGAASNPTAVVQALATFAMSAGFTVDNNAAYGGGWWLAIHKGACYLNFVTPASGNYIAIYGATGFSSSAAPSAQANSSPGTVCAMVAGPYTAYHFFSTAGADAYLHLAIELGANVFAHIQAGSLRAAGGASPCIYTQSTQWSSYSTGYASFPDYDGTNQMPWGLDQYGGYNCVGVVVDGTMRWFARRAASPSRTFNVWQSGGIQNASIGRSPNTFNGLPVLLSIPVFVERAVGGIYSYVGEPSDVRLVNLKNNNPKDEITIGSDVWKFFPAVAKNPNVNILNSPNPSSGNYAYAYRKNA